MSVLFISDSYLKQTTFVGENVQANVLTAAITKAQTIKIQSILGKALYAGAFTLTEALDVAGH